MKTQRRVCQGPRCVATVAGRKDRRYCSDACRNAAWRQRHSRVSDHERLATYLAGLDEDGFRSLLRDTCTRRYGDSPGRLRIRYH